MLDPSSVVKNLGIKQERGKNGEKSEKTSASCHPELREYGRRRRDSQAGWVMFAIVRQRGKR